MVKKGIGLLLLAAGLAFGYNCENRVFSYTNSLKAENRTTIDQFLSTLVTGKCGINIVYKDDIAWKICQMKMPYVKIKEMTLPEILDLLLGKRGLFYKIEGNTLEISYYKTKTFKLDWIAMKRSGSNSVATSSSAGGSGSTSTTEGASVSSEFDSDIWSKIKSDIAVLLKNSSYNPLSGTSPTVIVDPTAGLITVTGTKRQLEAVERYVKELVRRLTKEVLIDVKILSVRLVKQHEVGINWRTLQIHSSGSTSLAGGLKAIVGSNSIFKSGSTFSEEGLINFLATFGDVNSISNPKIVTLNNQKAIVTVGQTIYYKYASSTTTTGTTGNTQVSYTVGSKFVGVILDITPQISDDGTIILNVYPRISSLINNSDATNPNLDRPPATTDKTLSTIVRLKDGQTLVMGGLIFKTKDFTHNGVPVLKEIPLLKYLFGYKKDYSEKEELVFIITPHIINLNTKKTLRDLGFGGL
jgi:general secretion pathway protein D